jgi:hypothetical protein
MSGRCRFFNIALARSPPLAAAVKVESVVGRQGKMADVGRASIRREGTEYHYAYDTVNNTFLYFFVVSIDDAIKINV